MFFLRLPEAASKRTRVCFFGGEAVEKTHILFCARYYTSLQHVPCIKEFWSKAPNFPLPPGAAFGGVEATCHQLHEFSPIE